MTTTSPSTCRSTTPAGPPRPSTTAAKRSRALAVTPSLHGGHSDLLVEHYPAGLTRDELAEAAGITQTGGTFGTYLSRLRSNGLLDERTNGDLVELTAHPDLFMGEGPR